MAHRQTIYHSPKTSDRLPRLQWVGWKKIYSSFYRENKDKIPGSVSVQLSLNGSGAWWPDADQDDHYELKSGEVLLFFNGTDHLAYGIHPEAAYWEFAYFNVTGECALMLAEEFLWEGPLHCSIHNPTQLFQLMDPLMPKRRGQHVTLSETQLADLAMKLLLSLWEAIQQPEDPAFQLIHEAQHLMSRKINVVNVQSVANQLQVSREHLTRCFKAAGLPSPAVWLKEQRLQLAEVLIREDEAPLEEIALFVGFESYSHFFRLMNQRLGCQPSVYRARFQSNTRVITPSKFK